MRFKRAFWFMTMALLLALPSACSSASTADSMIIKVDENSLVKVYEESAVSYFEQNREGIQALASYLLENEKLFKTRPIVIGKEYMTDRIADKAIKEIAEKIFSDGIIASVWSLNDDPVKHVRFVVNGELDVYEQGLLFTSDDDIAKHDPTVYNDVKRYRALGGGWFYYMHHYDLIKDADKYRKAAWDMMSDNDKKSITTEWNKALVTLKDGKKDGIVVSVCFRTEQDGVLGPITIYFDPVTAKIVGGEPRY